ncbi:CDP-alcohol phosphatidyltransferase family protein [Rhodoligotrophos ferricapiens]|uniref:CDP-alcohol phosphatidyltransferase family protein n=1 Tax=Rhodoligotrophos ferricapiens TaxID=3069264 RepID=UPI00315D84AD
MISAKEGAGDTARSAYFIGQDRVALWHMSPAERLRRQLARQGIPVMPSVPAEASSSPVLLFRSDAVMDDGVITALAAAPETVLITADREPLALCCTGAEAPRAASLLTSNTLPAQSGYRTVTAVQLAGSHNAQLRKRQDAYAARVTPQTASHIERQLFDASYKGVTDVVTKYLWPGIAFRAVQLCTRFRITPNQVTMASLLFALAALALFWQGAFVSGLLCAWVMALLDTVDGKLARVTATSSKWGNVFDHGIDLIAPPLWWLGWWVGLDGAAPGGSVMMLAAVLIGHIAGKLVEQAFISTFGLKIHVWRPFDSTFRLFTARRNPNVVILTVITLLADPSLAYVAMMAWIYTSLLVHIGRYVYALDMRSKGAPIRTWLEEGA